MDTNELPYELIRILLEDICRLGQLVIDAREEANALAPPDLKPYPDAGENVWDRSYFTHPAVEKYEELYGPVIMKF